MSLIMDALQKVNTAKTAARVPSSVQPARTSDHAQRMLGGILDIPGMTAQDKTLHELFRSTNSRLLPITKNLLTAGLILAICALMWLVSGYFVNHWTANILTADAAAEKHLGGTAQTRQFGDSQKKWAPLLQGVFFDNNEPICLIDGKIMRQGDSWNGKKITAIHKNSVELADVRGNLYVLSPAG